MVNPLILAHRGYSLLFSENTKKAFKRAADLCVDGFEMDLRVCKDGKIVIIHDPVVDRVSNGEGKVKDYSFDEIRKFYVGQDEHIPLLDELWDWLVEDGRWINMEIKEREVVEPLVEFLKDRCYEKLIFSSFQHSIVYELKEKLGWVKIGLLYDKRPDYDLREEMKKAREKEVYSFHLPVEGVGYFGKKEYLKILDGIRIAGFKVAVWTLNDPGLYMTLRNHVDMVITDDPIVGVSVDLYETFRRYDR